MIIPNGYIETETITGGGIDQATGHAIASVISYSDKRYCQYLLKENLQGKVEGEAATVPSYDIYIDFDNNEFSSERIRLTDKSGRIIGRYAVRSIEMLEAVGQYHLIV